MPCSNVTEVVRLTLDPSGLIGDFHLNKETCGKSVGGGELFPYIKGYPAENILQKTVSDFVPAIDEADPVTEFLLCKHLYAIQVVLSAFFGFSPGRKDDSFAIEDVKYDPSGATTIKGYIRLDLKTREIKSCRGCSCSSKKPH